eukprot:5267985-Lingulodinium_polyedra.AAC.1
MTINIGRRGLDGKTPWERRYGRSYKRSLAEFGEKVLYLPTGKRRANLEERYVPGIFLGVAMQSSDVIVGRPDGTVGLARSFRRLPDGQRADRALFEGLRGAPWKPDPAADETPP